MYMDPYIPRDPHASYEEKLCCSDPRYRIDFSTSNTCSIDGDVYFSPNCSRSLVLPSQTLTLPLNAKVDDPTRFLCPQWFSAETPHLAFFPLSPLSGDAIDGAFSRLSLHKNGRKGFNLDPEVLLKWNKLDFNLILMSSFLLSKYNAPMPKPIIDDALICTGNFKTQRILQTIVTKTIDWFSERAARMSYAIAVALTMDDEPPSSFTPPPWFLHLVNRPHDDWDQAYVSSVRTTLGQFLPWTRAGVLVQVVDPARYQYSVDWLCKFNVPVWYPWGAKEMAAAAKDPVLRLLAPPVAELQKVHTILSKSPTADSDTQQSETIPPWISFFKEKHRRIEIALKTEDPKHRQARESREKNPPKKNTKVFIWEEDSSGTYIRTKVSAKWNADRLAEFSPNHRRYDSFNNEWDCGPFDGLDSDGESDDDDDDDEFPPPLEADEQMEVHVSSVASAAEADVQMEIQASSVTSAAAPASTSKQQMMLQDYECNAAQHRMEPTPYHDTYEWGDYYECSETLKEFFGFVPATSSFGRNPATTTMPVTDKELMFIKSIVGVSNLDDGFEKSRLALEIMEFIRPFMSRTVGSVPKNELWDLAESNHMYVGGAWRFKYMRLHKSSGGTFYVFTFGGKHATVDWDLGVTNAIDALYICRLHSGMTDYDICRQLLQRGIEFHTFLARKWTSVPRPVVGPPLPVRLPAYEFTKKDYEAYQRDFQYLLQNPRIARAALMKGGIVWRLVVSHVSFDDVYLGPTANVTLHSRGLCVDNGHGDTRLWDDDIATEELEAIVGVHICMTGQGDTFACKSWWPTYKTWNANSPRSFWSSLAEDKFLQRLRELEAGTAKPLSATEWKNWVRAPGMVRTVTNANLKSSEAFLQRLQDYS